jgi:hypothetical protein
MASLHDEFLPDLDSFYVGFVFETFVGDGRIFAVGGAVPKFVPKELGVRGGDDVDLRRLRELMLDGSDLRMGRGFD